MFLIQCCIFIGKKIMVYFNTFRAHSKKGDGLTSPQVLCKFHNLDQCTDMHKLPRATCENKKRGTGQSQPVDGSGLVGEDGSRRVCQ